MKLAYLSQFWQRTRIYHDVLKGTNKPSLRSLQIHILTLLMRETYYTPATFCFCFLMSCYLHVQPFYKNDRSFIYTIMSGYEFFRVLELDVALSGRSMPVFWGECTAYSLRVGMYSC
jgi:hypothetical protein